LRRCSKVNYGLDVSYSEDLGQLVSELTVAQLIQLAVVLDIPAADLLAIATP